MLHEAALEAAASGQGRALDEAVRILLVEDSREYAEVVERWLREAAPEASHFVHLECLDAALERLAADSFDLLILDLSLPDACDALTLRGVCALAAELPTVVLTASQDARSVELARRIGACAYLLKDSTGRPELLEALALALAEGLRRRGPAPEGARRCASQAAARA